jgi:UDP-N-acetylglucosamine pyrophosphorylase
MPPVYKFDREREQDLISYPRFFRIKKSALFVKQQAVLKCLYQLSGRVFMGQHFALNLAPTTIN